MVRCIEAERTGFRIVWGSPANSRTWWRDDARADRDRVPQDTADLFAAAIDGKGSDDPV